VDCNLLKDWNNCQVEPELRQFDAAFQLKIRHHTGYNVALSDFDIHMITRSSSSGGSIVDSRQCEQQNVHVRLPS